MTARVPTTAAPAAPRTPLALVTLLVLAVHALLLLGLPRWTRTVPVTGGPPVFETRTIALAPPAANPAPAVPAAPEPPPPPKPSPRPAPKPKPKPRSQPQPQPAEDLPAPSANVPSDVRPLSPEVAAATNTDPSLLQAAPSVTFGDRSSSSPIAPPLPLDQTLAVRRQATLPAIAPLDAASAAASDSRTPGTPSPPPPVLAPRPAVITYQATVTQGGRLVALPSALNWRHDGQSYDLRWTLYGPAIGDHSRYATGLVTARGLAPVTARGAGPEGYDLNFDYAQARLLSTPLPPGALVSATGVRVNRAGSARPGAAAIVLPAADATPGPANASALPPGIQDPASLLIELGALIAGDPARYPVGSHLALPMADGQGRDPAPLLDFAIVDDNDLVAAGQFEGQRLPALHLVHTPINEQDARIELWLGKRLDYLPARLLIVRPDGDRWNMTLQGAYLQTVPPPTPPSPSPLPASNAAPTP